MIGIKELAETLGISIGTVSRALNNKPDVNAKTRDLVLATAEKKGYVPNQSGQSLRRGTTNAIGLLVSQNETQFGTQNDRTILRLTDEIQTILAPHRLDLFVLPCPRQEMQFEFVKRIIARRMVDGFILKNFELSADQKEFISNTGLAYVEIGLAESDNATILESLQHLLAQKDAHIAERSKGKMKQKTKRL